MPNGVSAVKMRRRAAPAGSNGGDRPPPRGSAKSTAFLPERVAIRLFRKIMPG
jgi:hypothetical protein